MIKLSTLEIHENPEGVTIPLYRDNDLKGDLDACRMAYVTTVGPGMSKGPILHKRRRTRVMCNGGTAVLEYTTPDGLLTQCDLHTLKGIVADIPPGLPVMYRNLSEDETATFFVLTDYAWRPNDDESEKFNGWEDYRARAGT